MTDSTDTRASDGLSTVPASIPDADSGFTPENIADAEWLWANLPVGPVKFHDRPTHERALICHTVARFRHRTAEQERADVVASMPIQGAAVPAPHNEDTPTP